MTTEQSRVISANKCITYSTNYYQRLTLESWFTNLEQTPAQPLRHENYLHHTKDLLTTSTKQTDNRHFTNDRPTDFLTKRRIETYQSITFYSLHSQKHHSLLTNDQ